MKKQQNSHKALKEIIRAEVKRIIKEEETQVDPKIEDELEKVLDDAAKKLATDMGRVAKDVETKLKDQGEVEDVLKKNPEIQKLAKESVARRGKNLTEEERLNEEILSVTFLVGISLAIPSIVTLIGSVVKFIEAKLGSKTEMGDKLKHIGHEMHDGIIKFIMNGMKLIPGFSKLKPETQKNIASVVHIIIVAYLAIHSGGVAIQQVKAGLQAANVSTATIEGALTAVKSGEVAQFLKKTIMTVVQK